MLISSYACTSTYIFVKYRCENEIKIEWKRYRVFVIMLMTMMIRYIFPAHLHIAEFCLPSIFCDFAPFKHKFYFFLTAKKNNKLLFWQQYIRITIAYTMQYPNAHRKHENSISSKSQWKWSQNLKVFGSVFFFKRLQSSLVFTRCGTVLHLLQEKILLLARMYVRFVPQNIFTPKFFSIFRKPPSVFAISTLYAYPNDFPFLWTHIEKSGWTENVDCFFSTAAAVVVLCACVLTHQCIIC